MPVDDIVENWEAGEDELEIAANFRLPVDQVKAVLEYAQNIKMRRVLFDKNVPYPSPFGRAAWER